jgi:hypothetical protein
MEHRPPRDIRDAIAEARGLGSYADEWADLGNGQRIRRSVLGTRGYEAETRAAAAREASNPDRQLELDLENAIRAMGEEPVR